MDTLAELFDELWPNSHVELRDELLWMTSYPVTSAETFMAELRKLRDIYGPNITDALNGLQAEIDAEYQRYKEDQRKEQV